MSEPSAPLPPGSTIGILGGGQLGRMLAVAAAQLGYRCHVYCPDRECVAAEVAAAFTCADYGDETALASFAAQCDVLTYEFENIPTGPLAGLETPLHPPLRALEIAQDRLAEKRFVEGLGGRAARFAPIEDEAGLDAALAATGLPAILKTRRLGYDGKGQARVARLEEAGAALASIGSGPAIAEGVVDFDREFSVILARGRDGAIVFWPSCENAHEGGILARTRIPAHADILAQEERARAIARLVADALDFVGVLTIEFFAAGEGPIFNEMAPRVHNSGHWTIEGAVTSQFENHIRAICGLPLGDAGLNGARVEMRNLIGDAADGWRAILAEPGAHLHLYGKGEARPGRKMGHVTQVTRGEGKGGH